MSNKLHPKILLVLFLLIFISCEHSDSDIDNPSNNEFVILFPEKHPISALEMEDGTSLVFYDKFGGDLEISQVSSTGEIEWTKAHTLANNVSIREGSTTFIHNDLIYIYSGKYGINKYIFDYDGNLVDSESLSNENDYYLIKDDEHVFAIRNYRNTIDYIQYSLAGSSLSKHRFDFESQSFSSDISIKNDLIYLFGKSDFEPSYAYYKSFYCSIFDLNGNLINKINTETSGLKTPHSKIVLSNGNIVFSIYSLNNDSGFMELKGYDLRLFNFKGDLLNTLKIESHNNLLKISLLPEDKIGLAGGRAPSLSNLKLSQLTILDANLNPLYSRNIGSYDDNLETFHNIFEYDYAYYLIGRSFGRNGDFDLPNNSSGRDMFYYKLNK